MACHVSTGKVDAPRHTHAVARDARLADCAVVRHRRNGPRGRPETTSLVHV